MTKLKKTEVASPVAESEFTGEATISHLRVEARFGRQVVAGILESEGQQLAGTLAQLLAVVQRDQLELTNAQEVLEFIVCQGGFAA